MPITWQPSIDKKIGYWFILTLLIQIVAFTGFLVRLDTRVASLEDFRDRWDRFTVEDWRLLEQKLDFYIGTIQEIKIDLKEIKDEIKQISR